MVMKLLTLMPGNSKFKHSGFFCSLCLYLKTSLHYVGSDCTRYAAFHVLFALFPTKLAGAAPVKKEQGKKTLTTPNWPTGPVAEGPLKA